jgi:rfaE bifunctional protein kinase chain/domain
MKSFLKKYDHKIKTVWEVKKIIANLKVKAKVVMCHGNFDVVHLGHIRHLTYAKKFGSLLVVSITADAKIIKGLNRPHVPGILRALNLAALEIVDYVIIDNNSTPIKNLEIIKPNHFVKGIEYLGTKKNQKMSQKTYEEKRTVEKYGGKIIFSPGDLVLSSTKIINNNKPNIDIEKIIYAVKTYSIDFEKIKKKLLEKKKIKIHVIGDLIIDKYTNTELIGYNAKTPTPSAMFVDEKKYVGGAGVVSLHFALSGAEIKFTTVVGKDQNALFAKKILLKNNVECNFITDELRHTTEKNVFITDSYRILKIDKVTNTPVSPEIQGYIEKEIKQTSCDAIIFSDFRHGIFNQKNILNYTKNINSKILKIADSQVASRWGNISDFKNFDLITPNEKECRFAVADQDSNLSEISRQLYENTKFKNLILKLGVRGVFAVSKKKLMKTGGALSFPSFVENLVDPVGAGDSMLAYAVITFLKSKCLASSILVGSIAAAIQCENNGNKPVILKDLISRLDKLSKQLKNF